MRTPRFDDYEQDLAGFEEIVGHQYARSLHVAEREEAEDTVLRQLPRTLFLRLEAWLDKRPSCLNGEEREHAFREAVAEAQPYGAHTIRLQLTRPALKWLQRHAAEVTLALNPSDHPSYHRYTRAFVA